MPDQLTLAYLAGVIDSDGYVTIHRSTRAGKTYYAARIGIAGTRREPHDLAAKVWGGTVARYVPKTAGYRPQFQWSRTGDAAWLAIADVQPFLRVKAAQAALAMDLQEHVLFGRGDNPYPWMPCDYDPAMDREVLYDEMRVAIKALSPGEQWGGRTPKANGRELDGRTWDEYPAQAMAAGLNAASGAVAE